MLSLTWQLNREQAKSIPQLAELTSLSEKSAENVVRDLVMFGVAVSTQSQVTLDPSTEGSEPEHILQPQTHFKAPHSSARIVQDGRRLTRRDHNHDQTAERDQPRGATQPEHLGGIRRSHGPLADCNGYLVPGAGAGAWYVKDQGKVAEEITHRRPVSEAIFIGDTSPAKTVEALDFFRLSSPRTREEFQEKGYRNAVLILGRFGLVKHERGAYHLNDAAFSDKSTSTEIIWAAAQNEPTLLFAREFLTEQPTASGPTLGHMLNDKFQREWTASSETRIGNSIRQWAIWSTYGLRGGVVSTPPGRTQDNSTQTGQSLLFNTISAE